MIVHRATAGFWRKYDALPKSIQKLADKSFELLKENPRHPSLHFKRVKNVWSVRVSKNHRALAIKSDENFIMIEVNLGNSAAQKRRVNVGI